MRSIITSAIVALMVLLPLAGAQAQSKNKAAGTKYEAAKGLYMQGGLAVVKTNSGFGDANIGFDIGAGYRFLHWLAADADLYWGAREQPGGAKTRQFGLTINGKVYPIGLLSPKTIDAFQPYLVMGMGGGNIRVKNGGGTGTFIYRLGAGIDWMISDNIGLYTDASLNATPGFKFGNRGGATGVYTLGAKFVF
jgi:opacity protein-like surface antigen